MVNGLERFVSIDRTGEGVVAWMGMGRGFRGIGKQRMIHCVDYHCVTIPLAIKVRDVLREMDSARKHSFLICTPTTNSTNQPRLFPTNKST
jgi:hypothetical protein